MRVNEKYKIEKVIERKTQMKTILINDIKQVASFDVDCQNTFTPLCPNELPVPGGIEIVDELNRQARFAQYRLGSKDAHSPHAAWVANAEHPPYSPIDGANMDIRWVPHAIPGTAGFELIDGLPNITDYDFFVWKGVELDMHPYGACYHDLAGKLSTGVIEFLQQRGVTMVLVGGLATDYCVKTTVLQLLGAGFQVVINLAACRGISEATINTALNEMREAGVVVIDSTEQLYLHENATL